MAENYDLQRLEDQLYQYRPELKRDSEDVKSERRKRLCLQLRNSYPVVQLPAFDAITSLVNIKDLLDKCKNSVVDPMEDCFEMALASPSTTSLFESSSDEFLISHKSRRAPRKRKSRSSMFLNSECVEARNERKDQESPLSVSILIPQVVQSSDKMEISIDLGGINASQRIFASRVDGLLRNRSISSSNTLEDLAVREGSGTSNKLQSLQMTASTSSSIQTIETHDKQEDELLSRLISQVLVENNDSETLQATNVLHNINNNETSNYDAAVPHAIETLKVPKKKKAPRKPKKEPTEKGPPKKRGRKPKKGNTQDGDIGLPKSDLAKYVELFSNTCNMAGSATPAASSTMSQQMVTSTTHYLDSNDQHPITYYVEGDWANGGSCQLIQTESISIDGNGEEFNMAELVNYIDNVGDAGNVIARVLDGPNSVPILVQDSNSQINSVAPPPAHVGDVLLDLSKKSTMTYTTTASETYPNAAELENNDPLPLDLSLKTSTFNAAPLAFNAQLTTHIRSEAANDEVFVNNDYGSFEAALDMPLIDIDDNINAFMELTNSQVMTSENVTATGTNLTTVCDATITENSNISLPACDFELSGILSENNICGSDCNIASESGHVFNKENNGSSVSSTNVNVYAPESFKNIMNATLRTNEYSTDVRVCNAPSTENESGATTNHVMEMNRTIHPQSKETQHFNKFLSVENNDVNKFETNATVKADERYEIATCNEKGEINSEVQDTALEKNTNSTAKDTCKTDVHSNSDVTSNQTTTALEYHKNREQNECTAQDDIPNENPPKLLDIEGSVDNNTEELHGNLSEKSSIDFLFVDTESLPCNRLKYSYDEAITDSTNQFLTKIENDEKSNAADEQNGTRNNADVVCDLSTTNDHSKSIDLEEECEGHNVSLHLPMPQLTLMENSSEEFNYYDVGFESGEEKDLVTSAGKTQNCDKTQCKVNGEENNPKINDETEHKPKDLNATNERLDDNSDDDRMDTMSLEKKHMAEDDGKENSTFEDSAVFCSQKGLDASKEIELETPDLQQNENLDKSESLDVPEDNKCFNLNLQFVKCIPELSQNEEKVAVKEENTLAGLSVLEMESKLDDGCLDFEDELEDDALSLATSYFNSSDDERLAEHNTNAVQTSIHNIIPEKEDLKIEIVDNRLETENNNKMGASSNFRETPTTREVSGVSSDILKKFKIPKLSMTSATVKHSNPTGSMAAAAPLPMVILPPNAFQKQSIKIEPDSNKPAGFEKLTRTVQNICAVTPLTLQHSTYASPNVVAPTTSSSLEVVAPLIRDILQLAPPLVGGDVKDFKTLNTTGCSMATSLNAQQINCTRGEVAGSGGDGRNFGPPTIIVAKTFGVTCLPFLVGRCFSLTTCQFSHSFRDADTVKSVLTTLSEVDLNLAYKFAYNHEIVFRQYMREFCKIYIERNNRFKLLNMVRDCERYKGGGELLTIIFHSLTQCGLNKVNACRQILNYSRDRSGPTIDALVDIILEADWKMFCDYIEKFSDVSTYHFRLNVLNQMAPTILHANDQRMTSIFFKCLVNLDPKDVGLVHSSPILMQLLELIKNGQACR